MTNKPEFCAGCPITHLTEGYVPLLRAIRPVAEVRGMFVGEAAGEEEVKVGKPFVGGAGQWLTSMCQAARVDRGAYGIVNVVGCRPPKNMFPGEKEWCDAEVSTREVGEAGVRYCVEHHLLPAIEDYAPTRIVTLGNQALKAVTGRSGVLQWRGSAMPVRGGDVLRVMPTLHPAFLMRSAGMFSVAVADLKKPLAIAPENYVLWGTYDDIVDWRPEWVSFDFEWGRDGNISMCGLSGEAGRAVTVDFTPRNKEVLREIFESARDIIGHNIISADTIYFDKFGWKVTATLWDTLLMQHLVQPDMRHSLAFTASVFTNKPFWKGAYSDEEDAEVTADQTQVRAQWQTWDKEYGIPRELGGYKGCVSGDDAFRLYNARDTDASGQAYFPLKALLEKYGMMDVYHHVSVPVGLICRDIGEAGMRVDVKKLAEVRARLGKDIEEEEARLPEGLRAYTKRKATRVKVPKGKVVWKEKVKVCKGSKKAPHGGMEHLFFKPGEKIECQGCGKVLESGKMVQLKTVPGWKDTLVRPWNSTPQVLTYAKSLDLKMKAHGKTGKVTADKNARKGWGRTHPEFHKVDILKRMATMRNGFAREELILKGWTYYDLLVYGTREGRLSCRGRRKGTDRNIQNQPKEIRKIYVPDKPGYGFLSHDFKQGENMLTAWLAKDWDRWERLHTPGFDEHSYMASQFFNLPYESVCRGGAEENMRKPGKVINHGMNYGLGYKTALEYLQIEGFNSFSESDVKELIAIWKKVNAGTALWQSQTIALVQAQGFLRNVFGRVIWFQGRDFATKALAFLPASTLADIILRCMIAHYPSRFATAIQALQLETTAQYLPGWDMRIQVHDELVSHGPIGTYMDQAYLTKEIMTQPWKELDGFKLDVDVEWSDVSWGDVKGIEV